MTKVMLKFMNATLKEVPVGNDIVSIGRNPNNLIQIDNQAVSGYHAKIFKEGDWFFIEDMNSLNGTFVNGKKIAKCPLSNGDEVLVGKHTIKFVSDELPTHVEQAHPSSGRSMRETVVLESKLQQDLLNRYSEQSPPTQENMPHKAADKDAVLTVVSGSLEKKEYELKSRVTTIGKDENAEIRLKGFFMPKIVALVNRKRDGYFISPASSKSVHINGKQISERHELKDGDVVELGGVKLHFTTKE